MPYYLQDFYILFTITTNRVSKEEFRQEEIAELKWNETNATIPANENFEVDVSWDRLVDIYIFTAIIVATILVTLSRSFIFFSVSAGDSL